MTDTQETIFPVTHEHAPHAGAHMVDKPRRNTVQESALRARRFNVGKCWEEARQIAEMTSQEAAIRLGIPPSRLSEIEHNQRPPTFEAFVQAVKVYGCNADFLMGLTEDYDRDAVAATQRHVLGMATARINRVLSDMVEMSYLTMKQTPAFTGQAEQMAKAIIRCHEALESLKVKCPQFEEDMPTSRVVAAMNEANGIAVSVIEQMNRLNAALSTRQAAMRERIGDPSRDFFVEAGAAKQPMLI